PPYHNSWRRALNPFFSPKALAAFEPEMRRVSNTLIDALIDGGRCEFVADYAAHLPGIVLFRCVIPVPEEDTPALFSAIDTGTFGPIEERGPAFGTVMQYCDDLLSRRSQEPPRGGDIIDVILEGVPLPDGSACPWGHKFARLVDFAVGGRATTTHVMSGALYHLATHPDDRQALAADPSLVPQAVEE